jgi:hypothetical protein
MKKTQINKNRYENGSITKDTTEIQGIIGEYFSKCLYSNKLYY